MAKTKGKTAVLPTDAGPSVVLPSKPPPPPVAPEGATVNGEEKWPLYKVGPIATDKNNAILVCIWEKIVQTTDGQSFKVHQVTIEAHTFDPNHPNEDGSKGRWKSGKSVRGSQLYVLIYCLQR